MPHLYGFPWYAWARAFYNSTNRISLLCAANQISKSSTQIRKEIRRATDQALWKKLWPNRTPRQFWYLYPSKDVATIEFETKWVPEFMPRGRFKDDPTYGWESEYDKGKIHAIHWKSGIHQYFKTYGQNPRDLQSGTVDSMACDEELPEHLWDELWQRLSASEGYFSMVFTATLNQLTWLRAIEGKGESEFLPEAFKLQVSKYDCLVYDDGSPSPWTMERIKSEEASCSTEAEVQRRIYGRFVTELGRKYPQFSPDRHYIKPRAIPFDWKWYAAIDKGGGKRHGSKNNHYSAIAFLAVSPDFKQGYVAKGWRGDAQELTSQDVLDKFVEMRGREFLTMQIYPHDAKDFGIIAHRQGEPFTMADKSHERGEDTLNTLFKANMLLIFDTPELRKLGNEMLTLMKATPKDNAKDDLADALRYTAVAIPWDWNHAKKVLSDEAIASEAAEHSQNEDRPLTDEERLADETAARRGEARPGAQVELDSQQEFDEECDFWNREYG